ncbi:hypothetical protein [Micromonospora sp. WMMD812]|uniref:hypothetical protein n=1 Tax=Micromonospora sp. WMMD812 TaxID=3015152 RepID=UPI00248D17B1|nr:hypothetical protein [Micromonospora sp. WMMD812]WBB70647.1 hypothetical protein O7603_15375 [Micromonospora sp. WMMD812]
MADSLRTVVEQLERHPKMLVVGGTYAEVCAFLQGWDRGGGTVLIPGFREWLVRRGAPRPELAWPLIVLCDLYPQGRLPLLSELTGEENRRAIGILAELLRTYLDDDGSGHRRDCGRHPNGGGADA